MNPLNVTYHVILETIILKQVDKYHESGYYRNDTTKISFITSGIFIKILRTQEYVEIQGQLNLKR